MNSSHLRKITLVGLNNPLNDMEYLRLNFLNWNLWNLWVLWCSLHSNRILEPWLCRWVPFLTRTGLISIPFFKNSGPFLIPFSSGTRNSHTVYDIFWMEFYQSYECSRWVDIVLHCLLHSPSCFQGEERRGFGGGCEAAPRAAILQKIRLTVPLQNLLCNPNHTYFLFWPSF